MKTENLTPTERKRKAVQLRRMGFGYRRIADELNCSVGTAFNDIQEAFAEVREATREDAATLRDLELERLDDMLPVALSKAKKGDLKAIEAVLKIQDRRAKYLGLDKPEQIEQKVAITKAEDLTDDELAAIIRKRSD